MTGSFGRFNGDFPNKNTVEVEAGPRNFSKNMTNFPLGGVLSSYSTHKPLLMRVELYHNSYLSSLRDAVFLQLRDPASPVLQKAKQNHPSVIFILQEFSIHLLVYSSHCTLTAFCRGSAQKNLHLSGVFYFPKQ